MAPKALPPLSEDACRVCGREDDEEFLVLCDGCDRPFHTQCHVGCACCRQKPRNPFARKPAVPDGDWFCKFCAGHLPALEDGAKPVSAVYAWGDNEDGQLAMPETEDKAIWTPTRVHQLDAIGVLQIACTETTTFALCNDANVYSVGTGPCGQLGHQDVVHEKLVKFRKLEALMEEKRSKSEGRFSQLLAGKDFGVAVTTEGHVYTWGNGEYGQLGHQENKNKKAPKKISALRELEVPVDLAACGSDFVVMTTKEGDEEDQFNTQKPGVLISMGANAQGQLGDATAKNQWVPQFLNKDGPDLTPRDSMQIDDPAEFLLGRDIVAMSAGRAHSAVIVSGTPGIWTWGLGERGQLGHPKPAPPPGQSKFFRSHFRVMRPRFVQALENYVVKQVVCGGQHTLMLLQDGRVLGMGDNTYGQVGAPLAADMSSDEAIVELPTEITSLAGKVKHIGCGDEFSVVLSNSGEVYTWGRGQLGQLGLGENTQGPIATPTKVEGLPTITKVFVGLNQVFAVEFTNETLPPPLPANTIKKRGPRPGKAAGGAKRSKK